MNLKTKVNSFEKQHRDKKSQKIESNDESYALKMQRMQKQLSLLNLDVKSMLEQKAFKENVLETLIKEKKNFQTTFLFQNLQNISKAQMSQTDDIKILKDVKKNKFNDVNQDIKRNIQLLESTDLQNLEENNNDLSQRHKQNSQHLECQSKHLKEIFNPQDSFNTKEKSVKLREKLQLAYQKIQLALEQQEPYLHQKILQRIKRQAKKYSRNKVLSEIQKLIKQNSQWMNQETNRVSSKLRQQSIQEMCVENLGKMKQIMGKKVSNNDFIFENYSNQNSMFMNQAAKGFPVQKIKEKLLQILKKIDEKRIQMHLNMFEAKKKQQNKKSLIQVLKDPKLQSFIHHNQPQDKIIQVNSQQLIKRLQKISSQIEMLNKK